MIFRDESVLGVCRYHHNVEFQFLVLGQMSNFAEGKTSNPVSRSQVTLMYAIAG